MTDVHSPQIRSKNMRAIKNVSTQPEIYFRKLLYQKGYRYRIAPPKLPGKPDIYLPKYKSVIFINGCFWHSHGCKHFKLPQTRRIFWSTKLKDNVNRDQKRIIALINMGYRVLIVWECAILGNIKLSSDLLMILTSTWLSSQSKLGYISDYGLTILQPDLSDITGAIGHLNL